MLNWLRLMRELLRRVFLLLCSPEKLIKLAREHKPSSKKIEQDAIAGSINLVRSNVMRAFKISFILSLIAFAIFIFSTLFIKNLHVEFRLLIVGRLLGYFLLLWGLLSTTYIWHHKSDANEFSEIINEELHRFIYGIGLFLLLLSYLFELAQPLHVNWIQLPNFVSKYTIILVVWLVIFALAIRSDFKSGHEKTKNKPVYFWRIGLGTLSFVIGVLIIIYFRGRIFYVEGDAGHVLLIDPKNPLNDWPRFAWCLGSSLMGFGLAAVHSVYFSDKLPHLLYSSFYPFILLLITCLGYSIMYLKPQTSGLLFYPLSFAFCGTLGVFIDRYGDIINIVKGHK